jgi:putative transposase
MERKGWHSRGYIPHFDGSGLVQHVVLRTFNSLPKDTLEPLPNEETAQRRTRIDAALDRSQSGRTFAEEAAAQTMAQALKHFCGSRYDLLAWCVMPNHVHTVICAYPDHHLGQIVRSLKTFVTQEINRINQTSGPVFAKDYFDRYMRNGIQTERAIAYVENNPVSAGLCLEPHHWPWSSAFERAKGWKPRTGNLPIWLP